MDQAVALVAAECEVFTNEATLEHIMPGRYCKAGVFRSHAGRFVARTLLAVTAVALPLRSVPAAVGAHQPADASARRQILPIVPVADTRFAPPPRMPLRAMPPPRFAPQAGAFRGRMFSPRFVSRYRWPGGLPYRLYAVGALLPLSLIAAEYIVTDWAAYGVGAPAGDAVWLRYGPDLLLVDQQSGQVLNAAYGVFVEDPSGQPTAAPPVQPAAPPIASAPPASGDWGTAGPAGEDAQAAPAAPAGPNPSEREYAAVRPPYAPTPPPAEPAAAATREQHVLQFVQEFFARVTGNAVDVLDFEQRAYAGTILFYGHPVSRSAVLEQKAAYLKRWPICVNTVRPASTTVQCANEALCTFSGLVDWDCRAPLRPDGPAHACGTSSVTFDIATSSAPMQIAGESSSVVSRCP